MTTQQSMGLNTWCTTKQWEHNNQWVEILGVSVNNDNTIIKKQSMSLNTWCFSKQWQQNNQWV